MDLKILIDFIPTTAVAVITSFVVNIKINNNLKVKINKLEEEIKNINNTKFSGNRAENISSSGGGLAAGFIMESNQK